LIGKILAQGEAGPADGAQHVSTVGDLFHSHLLTKSNFAKLATSGSFDLLDLELTTCRGLTESQSGIKF